MSRLRWISAIGAAFLAASLLGVGMVQPYTMLWRLQLLAGMWLLSLLPRLLIVHTVRSEQRSLATLNLVLLLGLLAVGMHLGREQLVRASVIQARVQQLYPTSILPSPTPRPPGQAAATRLGQPVTWPVQIANGTRGRIIDRNGVVLAETRDGRRIYPFPEVAHLVGYASRLYGTSGVEASFNYELAGLQPLSTTARLESRLLGTALAAQPADVVLTLDMNLQQLAIQALGEWPGAVVVLDPSSGAILAMASYPRFDPNPLILQETASAADLAQAQAAWQALLEQPDQPLLNRASQGRYPPGSVIKTMTAAAALDSGVLANPQSQVTCPDQLPTEVGAPAVINAVANLKRTTGDPSDLRRVYAWSCNTAFAQLGLALGPQQFASYATRFGLGSADTPVAPALRDTAADAGTITGSWAFLERPAALADSAYGQGQALVTPLDMAQMVAIIANGGSMLRPYLVQEIRAGQDVRYTAQPDLLGTVISPVTAAYMRSLLASSVELGYARPAALPGIQVGGKTGTAEVSDGIPHSWFVGIAPADQPRVVIAVLVEHGGEGSQSALPIARTVLEAALR